MKGASPGLLLSVVLVTLLICCTRGLSSLLARSLCLLALRLRPGGGTVEAKLRPEGGALPSRRYSSSISPRW